MKRTFTLLLFTCLIFAFSNAQVSTFPYNEDFEGASLLQSAPASCDTTAGATFADWIQDPNDGGDWRADTAGTTSVGTGPGATSTLSGLGLGTDVNPGTTNGVYLYTEATNPTTCGNTNVGIISPYFDLSASGKYYQISLWYHMFGAGMGSLSVDVEESGVWTNNIWSISGDQDSIWLETLVSLANYNTDSVRVRIRAVMGTNFLSDCAIDHFTLDTFTPPPFDAILTDIYYVPSEYPLLPLTQFDSLSFEGKIKNDGVQSVSNAEISISEGSFSTTIPIGNLTAFQTDSGISSGKYFPTTSGTKSFACEASISETELDLTNNYDTIQIEVTDTVMAREDGAITGGIGFNAGTGQIGQMFELINSDTVTTVSVFIQTPTPGDSIKVHIYQFGSVPGNLIESSDTVIMTTNKNWYVLKLRCHAILAPGKYFVAVEQLTNASNMSLGYTTDFYKDSTTFYGTPAAWTNVAVANFFITCHIRMNFGSVAVPPLTISANKDTVCPEELVFLTADAAETYSWTPSANMFNPTSQTTLSEFTTSTTVNLTVDFGCGVTNSASYFIYVKDGPSGTVSSDTTVCSGTNATLSAVPGAGDSYSWTGGPSNMDWTVTPTANTTYNVVFAAPNGCTIVKSVDVYTQDGSVTALGDTTVCEGEMVTVTATGANSYQWAGGPGTADYSFVASAPGTYYVVGFDTLGCSATDSVMIGTNTAPNLIPMADTGACFLQNITLTAGGTADEYTWSTGSDSSTTTFQVFNPVTVTLYASNTNGCESYDTVYVDRFAPPSATIDNDTTICEGSSLDISAYGGATYVWSTNDSTQTITVSPTTLTTYNVVVYSAEGCQDNEDITIALDPLPFAGFSVGSFLDSVVVNNSSTDATSYLWDFGDGNTSTDMNAYNIYDTSGTYTITLTATNPCGSSDSSFTIDVTVPGGGGGMSVGEIDGWNNVNLYPIPAHNSINFSISNQLNGNMQIRLYDVAGRLLSEQSKVKNGLNVEGSIDLNTYPDGMYMVEFQIGTSKIAKRILKGN